jgi:hypothetical protein
MSTDPITAKPPAIAPENVIVQYDGAVFRELFVRLPKDLQADDLKEPSIWRKVQASRATVRKLDRVTLVSWSEDWIGEAVVAHADETAVVLAKPRITTFPPRYDRLFEDDRHRVVWAGTGYRVQRKSDGALVTDSVATMQLAERDLRNLYPRPVA